MNRQEFVNLEMKALRHKIFRIKVIVSRILKQTKDFGFFNPNPQDQLRLYNLWIWSVKYKVPIPYVIKSLMQVWQNITKTKKKTALGVSVTKFTSRTSEKFLQQQILKDFPNGENIAEWRLEQQERLLGLDEPRGLPRPLLDIRFPDRMMHSYKLRVDKRAKILSKANASQSRKARAWRGNPWVR